MLGGSRGQGAVLGLASGRFPGPGSAGGWRLAGSGLLAQDGGGFRKVPVDLGRRGGRRVRTGVVRAGALVLVHCHLDAP
jgi:hypothetical protein